MTEAEEEIGYIKGPAQEPPEDFSIREIQKETEKPNVEPSVLDEKKADEVFKDVVGGTTEFDIMEQVHLEKEKRIEEEQRRRERERKEKKREPIALGESVCLSKAINQECSTSVLYNNQRYFYYR